LYFASRKGEKELLRDTDAVLIFAEGRSGDDDRSEGYFKPAPGATWQE